MQVPVDSQSQNSQIRSKVSDKDISTVNNIALILISNITNKSVEEIDDVYDEYKNLDKRLKHGFFVDMSALIPETNPERCRTIFEKLLQSTKLSRIELNVLIREAIEIQLESSYEQMKIEMQSRLAARRINKKQINNLFASVREKASAVQHSIRFESISNDSQVICNVDKLPSGPMCSILTNEDVPTLVEVSTECYVHHEEGHELYTLEAHPQQPKVEKNQTQNRNQINQCKNAKSQKIASFETDSQSNYSLDSDQTNYYSMTSKDDDGGAGLSGSSLHRYDDEWNLDKKIEFDSPPFFRAIADGSDMYQ